MKRILMMVLRNIILVPFMWCKLCYHAHHVDKYTEEEHYKMLKFIVRRANKGGNVTIAAEGLDNIPKENGFMFFPNHQGMYDVWLLWMCVRFRSRLLQKRSCKYSVFKAGVCLYKSIYD